MIMSKALVDIGWEKQECLWFSYSQSLISKVYNYFHLALSLHHIQMKLPVDIHPILKCLHLMCKSQHQEFYLYHLMH